MDVRLKHHTSDTHQKPLTNTDTYRTHLKHIALVPLDTNTHTHTHYPQTHPTQAQGREEGREGKEGGERDGVMEGGSFQRKMFSSNQLRGKTKVDVAQPPTSFISPRDHLSVSASINTVLIWKTE